MPGKRAGLPEPSPGDSGQVAALVLEARQLMQENAGLRAELAALKAGSAELGGLDVQVDQLREANQNLVLATLSAQASRDAGEVTNQRQNEFLAMLAHELRNPLAPISMASEMLARMPAPSTELLNLQAIINRQVLHLSRLLDDLLDGARINSGKITLLRRPTDLGTVLKVALDTVHVRLRDRRQALVLALPPAGTLIHADPVRLAQVFANLLVNASKFTQNGGQIELAALVNAENVVVTVKDNGTGMSADTISHVFSLFTQGPRSLARSEGGLGVGLNVVQNIVHLHGGEVLAESAGLSRGSTFTVTLLLNAASAVAAPPMPLRAKAARGRRILLVEDNPDASETLSMFLTSEGHTVTTAFNGITGLALAKERRFDLLICDIGLPGMDGYELIRDLRESTSSHIPFAIAVSGYGQAEDQTRAIAAGFGQYFVKPVDVDALLTLIASDAVSKLIGLDR